MNFKLINKGTRFGKLVTTGNSRNNGKNKRKYEEECICDCGNVRWINKEDLLQKYRLCCGCSKDGHLKRRKILIGKQFGELTVIDHIYEKYKHSYCVCRCTCGKMSNVISDKLISGRTKSCGCLRNRIINKRWIGQKFKKLTVLKYDCGRGNSKRFICKCDCGEITSILVSCLYRQESCGKCKNFINGVPCSSLQFKLSGLISSIYNTELNYKIFGKYIDIALVDNNIAIEYDSWAYHSDTIKEDQKRRDILINNGWKVISVKSTKQLPTKETLIRTIEKILTENINFIEIIMNDWGTKPIFKKSHSISKKVKRV